MTVSLSLFCPHLPSAGILGISYISYSIWLLHGFCGYLGPETCLKVRSRRLAFVLAFVPLTPSPHHTLLIHPLWEMSPLYKAGKVAWMLQILNSILAFLLLVRSFSVLVVLCPPLLAASTINKRGRWGSV